MREKQPGVWEVRVFTGTNARGRPTQLSRTVGGSKRDARRVAAELEVGPGRAAPAGRTVDDVLDAWLEQNTPSSAREQRTRVRAIKQDPIVRISLARLSIADVERWHTRLHAAGRQDAGIKNLHDVLRASLAQAERWGWVSNNVAALARRRSRKTQPRSVMSLEDVRGVMVAAAQIDPAAVLAFRIAAVTGARRAELAALQWTDVADGQLTIDSAIEIVSRGDGSPVLRDSATKTANTRTLTLDPDTLALISSVEVLRHPYGPWMFGLGT